MTLDRDVVVTRLGHMRELLDDLESVGSVNAARLRSDRLVRHAVERILTQLVDLGVSINTHVAAAAGGPVPLTYRESFHAAERAGVLPADLAERLAPSAGLRNLLTHEYAEVDLDLVAAAIPVALADYREFVTAVAQALRS